METQRSLVPTRWRYSCCSVRFALNSVFTLVLLLGVVPTASSQGNQVLFGDIRIRTKDGTVPNLSVTLVLYGTPQSAGEMGRQTISNRGRYRFSNLKQGEYELAVEVDGNEIGRLRNIMVGPLSNSPYGFQYDLDFEWKPGRSDAGGGLISAEHLYHRSAANQVLLKKAEEAAAKKNYEQAAAFSKISSIVTMLISRRGPCSARLTCCKTNLLKLKGLISRRSSSSLLSGWRCLTWEGCVAIKRSLKSRSNRSPS